MNKPAKTQRTASTHVDRYMGQRTLPTDARRVRTARYRHHQLRLSGLVLLNGFSFARFLGFGRGLGFVGPGMGNCFGLGCSLHQASPTISITSTLPTCLHGVMQNHQPETISTSPQNSASENFLHIDPMSEGASGCHPFRRTPYSFSMAGDCLVTEHL